MAHRRPARVIGELPAARGQCGRGRVVGGRRRGRRGRALGRRRRRVVVHVLLTGPLGHGVRRLRVVLLAGRGGHRGRAQMLRGRGRRGGVIRLPKASAPVAEPHLDPSLGQLRSGR